MYVHTQYLLQRNMSSGTDLLSGVIPAMCAADARVKFLIGGDGPKRLMLEELCEQHRLHDRVTLLGQVKPSAVRDVLVKVQRDLDNLQFQN